MNARKTAIKLVTLICWSPEARRPENKNSTRRQRLRRLQRSRLELSAVRTPSFIADCCNVRQALKNSLVLVPELAHLRIFILRFTNVLIINATVIPIPKPGKDHTNPTNYRPIALTSSQSKIFENRMWANAQPDGRPAERSWRPLFNAAKFGWRPLLDAVQ